MKTDQESMRVEETRIRVQALANARALDQNPYPGRGVGAGLHPDGKYLIQAVWTMGRSDGSRNRVMLCDKRTGRMWTEPANWSKVKSRDELRNIIYESMLQELGLFVAGNGNQVKNMIEGHRVGVSPYQVLCMRQFEDDDPNCTPRIAVACFVQDGAFDIEMSILRQAIGSLGVGCDRHFFRLDPTGLVDGIGHFLTTYTSDGNPLPPYVGEPFTMPFFGSDIRSIAGALWDRLNKDNRVSLGMKFIPLTPDGTMQVLTIDKSARVNA